MPGWSVEFMPILSIRERFFLLSEIYSTARKKLKRKWKEVNGDYFMFFSLRNFWQNNKFTVGGTLKFGHKISKVPPLCTLFKGVGRHYRFGFGQEVVCVVCGWGVFLGVCGDGGTVGWIGIKCATFSKLQQKCWKLLLAIWQVLLIL